MRMQLNRFRNVNMRYNTSHSFHVNYTIVSKLYIFCLRNLLLSCSNEPSAAMLLIRHGANINANNGNGCTALHVAANKGHKDMVSCLIEGGADLNLKVGILTLVTLEMNRFMVYYRYIASC